MKTSILRLFHVPLTARVSPNPTVPALQQTWLHYLHRECNIVWLPENPTVCKQPVIHKKINTLLAMFVRYSLLVCMLLTLL